MRIAAIGILLVFGVELAKAQNLSMPSKITKLAFGSCNDQYKNLSFWPKIAARNPDVWLWLGDIVYADHASPSERQAHFDVLKNNQFYKNFAQGTPIIGTWDDHDYAYNDAGSEYQLKEESKLVLANFLDYSLEHEIFTRKGVYHSYEFGQKDTAVLLMVLDVRSFRGAPYRNNTILGPKQWEWIRETLDKTSAKIVLMASATQFIPMANGERWANFLGDKNKMLHLIQTHMHKGKRFVMLTGDRHFGEISKLKLNNGKYLYEISASGLTHTNPKFVGPHTYRVGREVLDRHFGEVEFIQSSSEVEILLRIVSLEREKILEVKVQ